MGKEGHALQPTRTLKEFFKKGDVVLLLLCILASLMGLVLIYSATQYYEILRSCAAKQAAFLCLGVIAYVWVTFIDIEFLMEKWWWVFLLLGLGVILTIVPWGEGGDSGNKSWVYLPVIGKYFGFQPGEIAKLAYIVVLAWLINKERPQGPGRFSAIVKYVILTGVFAGMLAVLSGDWGMVLVYLFIFAAMAWVAGVSKWWFIGLGVPMAGAVVFLWHFILPRIEKLWNHYTMKRFRVVVEHLKGNNFEPRGAGWQQSRSLLAIGSGRLTGMGFMNGTQTHSPLRESLPARHTDNIFAVCGEEFGMIGCCVVLLVLLAIILRCIWVSRRARSYMSAYIAMGIAAMLMAQTVINVAMCLYVGPVIGVTLPFFSYGGSSTLTLFIAMGLVSGIKMRPLPSWLKDRSQL
ncbi:MAG: FtsW/RodA/SpoVE family cell cycle protein [Oscillospiraceae bacterium]|nr:FtsW/RodA/SpoVE family cell cycle protein [Oscillospiraceae bacterium]